MKSLTIAEQMNACIAHANRNNKSIDSVEIYLHGEPNHQVIVNIGGNRRQPDGTNGHQYISVAVLMNASRRRKGEHCGANETTWDLNRN